MTARPRSVRIWSPAKVNLSLVIQGVRQDGYHLLESIIVPVSLCDRVVVSLTNSPGVSVRVAQIGFGPFVPAGPGNLTYKAAEMFLAEFAPKGAVLGIEISVEKFIPVGAGMGGGSSDAAAVLHALNRLTGAALDFEDLRPLALRIGADVPCLLLGRPAYVGGIGEQVRPYDLERPLHMVVCFDGTPLGTADVFRAWDRALTVKSAVSNIRAFPEGDLGAAPMLHNDLESVAEALRPEIARMKECLREEGVSQVAMSGSGSAVFGICQGPGEARRVASRVRLAGYWAEAVRTLENAWAFH